MSWYAAHLIMAVRKPGLKNRVPAWENVVLIQAESEEQAYEKAEERGRTEEGDDTFRWEGEAATLVFGGIRKLVLCEDAEDRPGDGTEVSYTELEFESEEALRRLIAGEPVNVLVNDDCREDDVT